MVVDRASVLPSLNSLYGYEKIDELVFLRSLIASEGLKEIHRRTGITKSEMSVLGKNWIDLALVFNLFVWNRNMLHRNSRKQKKWGFGKDLRILQTNDIRTI